jgi:hypothetical protein
MPLPVRPGPARPGARASAAGGAHGGGGGGDTRSADRDSRRTSGRVETRAVPRGSDVPPWRAVGPRYRGGRAASLRRRRVATLPDRCAWPTGSRTASRPRAGGPCAVREYKHCLGDQIRWLIQQARLYPELSCLATSPCRLPWPSLPLAIPCCHSEPAKGPQHTYKSILVLGGDDLVPRPSPIYSPGHRIRKHAAAAAASSPLQARATAAARNSGRPLISDSHHPGGDGTRFAPSSHPLSSILQPPYAPKMSHGTEPGRWILGWRC